MIVTLQELIDIIAMTFFVGFIFKDYFRLVPKPRHHTGYDPLEYYTKTKENIFLHDLLFSCMIAAPAIVLHEFGHKFAAMYFGATAVLHAPYFMYLIILGMKLMKFPLLFFVGGYVAHSALPPLQSSFVSFAGPLVNLTLYVLSILLVRYNLMNKKYMPIAVLSGKLNLFLFLFNMIPIPGFDGYGMMMGLWQAFA